MDYDFGTTVGTIHVRYLYSNSHSKPDKSQLVIKSTKRCIPFNYIPYSKSDYELLLLQNEGNDVIDEVIDDDDITHERIEDP